MWNPIKAYTDHRDAKDAEYQRQEQQARQERDGRRTAERVEIRKMVDADHARRAEINRPGDEAWKARQEELKAEKDAEKRADARILAEEIVKVSPTWTELAPAVEVDNDWGGWDTSSLDSSLGGSTATYGGDEAQI